MFRPKATPILSLANIVTNLENTKRNERKPSDALIFYIFSTKREEILYKNFVAVCKAKPMVCLLGTEIGGIDFPNTKTY
jgi:hypothetical protein